MMHTQQAVQAVAALAVDWQVMHAARHIVSSPFDHDR